MPPRVDEATDKLVCRQATPEEAQAIFTKQPGGETHTFVLERGSETLGHVCLTKTGGEWFGHDFDSLVDNGAVRLLSHARKFLRAQGAARFGVHLVPGMPRRHYDFWMGFKGASVSYTMLDIPL